MVRSKFTPKEKELIILEFFNTHISIAEICRKHKIQPSTFYQWKKKFIDGGKSGLNCKSEGDIVKNLKNENDSLKRLIGEITMANNILKKHSKRAKDD